MSNVDPAGSRNRVATICAFCVAIASVAAPACSKKSDAPEGAASGAPPSGAAVAPGSAAAPVRPVALTAEPEKVWASGVSVGTGITPTELDSGRVAFGVESGRGPEVVVFDSKGEGKGAQVRLKKELTTELKKEDGKREILRVTPALGSGGEVVAFVDYREIGDARRLVACGPSDSSEDLLKFEGKPLIETSDDAAEKPKADESQKPAAAPSANSKTAAAPPKPAAPASANPAPGPAKPAVAPVGTKPPPARAPATGAKPPVLKAVAKANPAKPAEAPAKAAAPASTDAVRELRECRTLVDRGGAHAWAVGSELVGKPAADGSTEWNMVIFAEQERGRGRADLSTSPLGKAPTKLPVYESAIAYDMGGGNFVLAARFRGALFAWVLDASKHARGAVRVYSGGYPAQPHLANLGSELALILVQSAPGGQKSARAARFAADVTSLPSSLSDLVIPDRAIEPPVSAAVIGASSTRFVAYQSDEIAKRLSVVQVDGNLAAAGEPVAVDVGVHDSELFALGDGRLLVVYVRVDQSGKSELVSKTLRIG